MSKAFVVAVHAFVHKQEVALITFEQDERKDDVMTEHLARFAFPKGIVFTLQVEFSLDRPLGGRLWSRTSFPRSRPARVLALFSALAVFRLLPQGFSARELREHASMWTSMWTRLRASCCRPNSPMTCADCGWTA